MKAVIRSRALTVVALAAVVATAYSSDLTIAPSGSHVIVSWPQATTDDFYLEFTPDLVSPITWRPTPDPFANVNSWVVTNDTAGTSRFYHLRSWEILFDGSSTSAFRGYRRANFPDANIWRATTNGELEAVVGGVSVDVITRNQYADFDLRWEWKTSVGGNSGVNYRATEEYSRAEWSGPEWQLLDDPSYSTVPENTCGAVWNLIAPTNKTLLPAGQWNRCRLLVQSNHVEHWLNGQRVVSYELDSPAFLTAVSTNPNFNGYPNFAKARSGYIVFRHENRQIWYRNIRIRQMPPD